MGEPLGDSATYRKADGGLVLGGGGGGGGSSGTQTQVSELPEWAKPYAKSTLEKGAALSEKPYQAYNAPRIAGFSPLQQQAQQAAAGMTPSQATAAGIDVAGAAALGGLGQNYQAGQFQGGRFGNRQAAQYMSPFIQEALAPQLREAQRSSEMLGQQNAARAVGQGAFGGSRSALVEAERQRNLGMQMGDIRAKGLQDAYNQAASQFNADQARSIQAQQLGEQSRQFGANIGLQGLNTALQGASQLGALGGQQFQQGMDINKLQSAYGGQQQALRQQGLSQAYEDFQNEQNYPYKQLGFMSDLIRGLPLGQQTTKSMYEGPGSLAGQVAGLGMGAYGLSKLSNFMAEGGEVHGYADGGSVDSAGNIESIVKRLSDAQLQQAAQAAQARGDVDQLEAIRSELAMRASERSGMAGAFNSLPEESQESMTQMAGGGVVAFSGEDNSYVIDPMLGTMQDTTASTDDRTVMERLGLFNPENRRALEKAEREIAASKVVKTPEEKAFAATSTMALDSEDAKAFADQKAKATKASAKSIGSNAVVRQATEIAKSAGIPQETFEDTIKRIRKEISSEDESFKKEMAGQYQKAVDRLNKQKQQAGAEALMQYGFGLASQASKPGARFMGSVAGASPILSQALAESNKASRAAEDNLDKLRMDQLRFEQAMRRNDLQSAAQYAGLISSDKKAQRQLDLQEKQLGITAAYHAQAGGSSLGKIVNELAQRDPEFANLSGQEQFKRAAQLAGYGSMYRADVGNQARMAEGIRKINEKYAMLGMLPPGSDMAKTMAAKREQDIADFKAGFSLSGEPSGGGVADNGGMRIVGVR
jgi:hypothetical protein